MDGILVINKEKGFTSNDVVCKLRGILKLRKIGHTGTLDPEAEGVLPVCIGKGTKLVNILTDTDKEYSAAGRLGVTTDTEDMTGNIIKETEIAPGEEPDKSKLEAVMKGFIGGYAQIPPMYSAKKVNGKKLYELAREGREIERKPCQVVIRDIVLKDYGFPYFSFSVCCGKGTYIRSLIRDIGERLGTGAAMESLVRTRVSEFRLEDAITLKEAEDYTKAGKIGEYIKSPESLFLELPKITVSGEAEKLLRNGNPFSVNGRPDGEYRVYTEDGVFAALYSVSGNRAKLERMFL